MMHESLLPTQDPGWVLTHEGYNVLTENAVESRFALGNGFRGMRDSRPVSRGPTWVSWQGYVRWASWPRCYVAGLFDRPNTVPPVPALVPVADWSRVRLVLDDNPQLLMDGEFLASVRQLDMRRGILLADLSYRAHGGITISGGELRLVSLADRVAALQLLRFSFDRDGIDVMLEANFAMAGMGMEPLQLDRISVPGARRAPAKRSRWRAASRCEPMAVRSSRSGRSRCAGSGAGVRLPDRCSNSTVSSLWHVRTVRRRTRLRLPPMRWRADARLAGAGCWQHTRPHGSSVGTRATSSSRVTMRCRRRPASPFTILRAPRTRRTNASRLARAASPEMRISAMCSGIPRSICCPSMSRSGRRRRARC